jgi:hypothetical protein
MAIKNEQITEARQKISKYLSNNRIETEATKQDFDDALEGLDSYLDDNAAAINQAIPESARAKLNVNEKAMILKYLVDKRMEV